MAKAYKQVKDAYKFRYQELVRNALPKVTQLLFKNHMRILKKHSYLLATLYFESDKDRIDPHAKVEVFGEFTKNSWSDKILCQFDPFFGCFKSEKVKIRVGQ